MNRSTALAARLCLARPDGTMLLFVAEGPWNGSLGEYAVAGFKLAASTPKVGARTTMSVSYEGPMVRYPTHDAFLDLEKGLAGSAKHSDSSPSSASKRHGALSPESKNRRARERATEAPREPRSHTPTVSMRSSSSPARM